MKSMENQAKHHRSLWSSEDLILQTNNTMENQAKNHRSLWSSEDLILQTNNRVQTPSQNPATSCHSRMATLPQQDAAGWLIRAHTQPGRVTDALALGRVRAQSAPVRCWHSKHCDRSRILDARFLPDISGTWRDGSHLMQQGAGTAA